MDRRYNIDDALELLDLRAWLEDYTEIVPVGTESEFRITCPECLHDKQKLYVNEVKRLWNCHHCDFGRGIFDPCVLMAKVSGRHINDVKIELASTVVPATSDESYTELLLEKFEIYEQLRTDSVEIVEETLPGTNAFSSVFGKQVHDYGLKRGIPQEWFEEYQLRSSLRLRAKFGPWLVFPVTYKDVPVAYQGRKIIDKPHDPIKYLSSDNIGNWLWPMNALENTEYTIMTEGVFDAMGFRQAGFNAVCSFGSHIKKPQIRLLCQFGIKRLFLAYDSDAWTQIRRTVKEYEHLFDIYIIDISNEDSKKIDPGNVLDGKIDKSVLEKAFDRAFSVYDVNYFKSILRKEI